MKLFLIALALLLIVASAVLYFYMSSAGESPVVQDSANQMVIGFLMASNSSSIERWIKDRDLFIERAEELGAKVIVLDAGVDADLQYIQAENLILQGVDVLVVVPQDADKSGAIVEKAHQAGIKVIAYDRLINTGKFAYVGGSETDTNAFLVKEGAFNVLQPLIDSGDIEVVFEEFTEDWKQDVAYTNMKNFLDAGNTVDAVVAANDSTAVGVILALEEYGLAGKVPVSGQDASLTSVQYVVEGKQTVTVYKPIKDLARKSAEIAVSVIKNEKVVTNNVIENGSATTPAFLLDVVSVIKDTVDETVIADGFHSREEIYGR